MPFGENKRTTLILELPDTVTPAAQEKLSRLPDAMLPGLGERALTGAETDVSEVPSVITPAAEEPAAEPLAAQASAIPSAASLAPTVKPMVLPAEYQHPLMTPKEPAGTPEERLAAAMQRYGAGTGQGSAQNRYDAQLRRTRRVQDGLEPYSVVTALTGGYLHGFRR